MNYILEINTNTISKKYTCFEVMLLNICRYWNLDFYNIFAWRWMFNYNKKKACKSLNEQIPMIKDYDTEAKLYRKYLGLKMSGYSYQHKTFKTIIAQELNVDNPIGILIDTYFCSWNPLYKKSHTYHFCLVIGMSENSFYICDTYIKEGIINVKHEEIDNKLVDTYLIFRKLEQTPFSVKDLLVEGFNYNCINEMGEKSFDNIKQYGLDLQDCIMADIIMDDELLNPKISPTLRTIKTLSDDRYGLYNLLNHNRIYLKDTIVNTCSYINNLWSKCLNRYIYFFLKKDVSVPLKSIADIYLEISEKEKVLYELVTNSI